MPVIAQIAAYPGAGKTYMANALMAEYKGSALLIKDTDDMLWKADRAAKNNLQKFQDLFVEYMRTFEKKHSSKLIVFVGTYGFDPAYQQGHYPVLTNTTLIWMDVPIKVAVDQSAVRYLSDSLKNPKAWLASLRKQPSCKIDELLSDQLNPIAREATWGGLKDIFIDSGFVPKSRKAIIKFIIRLVDQAHSSQMVATGSKRRKLQH